MVWIVTWMAAAIFVIGISLLIVGVQAKDFRLVVPSAVLTGFLYWPINKILQIRKENIQLSVVPALIQTLPPEKAAEEIVKLIEKLDPK